MVSLAQIRVAPVIMCQCAWQPLLCYDDRSLFICLLPVNLIQSGGCCLFSGQTHHSSCCLVHFNKPCSVSQVIWSLSAYLLGRARGYHIIIDCAVKNYSGERISRTLTVMSSIVYLILANQFSHASKQIHCVQTTWGAYASLNAR